MPEFDPRTVALVLAAVDTVDDAARVLASVAELVLDAGIELRLVDQTARARLSRAIPRRGALATWQRSHAVLTREQAQPDEGEPQEGAAVLVLCEVRPGLGVESVRAWAPSAVLVVGAGRTSVEGLQTAVETFAVAGIPVTSTVLVDTDRGDVSSGWPPGLDPAAAASLSEGPAPR